MALYGSNPVDDASKDDYFESLFYSSAVVGLNTSAFLEGAVVGRPVHTVLLPEFHENQEGVLHFHYLLTVGGGVLQAGRTFAEHHAQLAASLAPSARRPGAGFVREFVRPHGSTSPATPVFCDAVEELLRQPAPAAGAASAAFRPAPVGDGPVFRGLRLIYGAEMFRDDWSRKQREHELRQARHAQVRAERQQARGRKAAAHAARGAEAAAQREAALRSRAAVRDEAFVRKDRSKRAKQEAKTARSASGVVPSGAPASSAAP